MIWSIIPEELIFAAEPEADRGRVVYHGGRKLQLRRGRVETLISSDPLDYLDRRFQPGAVFEGAEQRRGLK